MNNNKPKLTMEQRLLRDLERNEAELRKAEERRKQLKEKQRELERLAYENRLLTRAKILEEFLLEPNILTNKDVYELLAYLFKIPANQQHLNTIIAARKSQSKSNE